MRKFIPLFLLAALGCDFPLDSGLQENYESLSAARADFKTRIVSEGESFGPPDEPTGGEFELIHYESPVGPLAAYLTVDPGDGQKHPAMVWITGGDTNSIGDVWTLQNRNNDQTARAFRKAGMVMMFPSQRGGNNNPGQREGFYGEVDDILAATDYLEKLPYVDPEQIYLGGHSSGGTMVMLVAACTDRYRAIFALGPVAKVGHYGGELVYCSPYDRKEMRMRSPIYWLQDVKTPLYVFEGAEQGNWDSIEEMSDDNSNPNIQFFRVPGHDHFSLIAPLTEKLARQIMRGEINLTDDALRGLK